ncbi:MAG: cell division ATP-binding protein FtsE [Clostridiales bacterium]|jgi:cell division transport system ATP-binding protein|nr:cell division ATP-binding protein FtsE [Clostridiales bacterium]
MIEFRNLTKIYPNGTKALKDVNIKIEKGEFVFIVGASGAGKSTLLKIMMREEVATSGSVIINNYNLNAIKKKDIPKFRRTMGIVFQDFRLIPNLSAYDNVAFAMRVIGAKEREVRKRVTHTLSLVGLSSKAKCLPAQLSGGEQQRVALARALVNNADLIIADEPTGNIDPEMSYEIVDLLNHLNANGKTIVMVTHEHELVRRFKHRVIVIKEGRVVADLNNPDELDESMLTECVETGVCKYFDMPNENPDIEEFLRSYGAYEDSGDAESKSSDDKETEAEKEPALTAEGGQAQ